MLFKWTNPLEQCHLKFASDESGCFDGYASVFNSNDAVNDTILPGAFEKSIQAGHRVKMFINHQQHEIPVGDWIKMAEDERGLYVQGQIDLNHKDGPTAYSAAKRGALDGLSVGFTMDEGDFEQKSGGGRNIHNMKLMEVSLVNYPCEGQARITAVKADMSGLCSLGDCEDYLRDVGGFSKSMAKVLVSHIVKTSRADAVAGRSEITERLNSDMLETIRNITRNL